MTNRIPSQTSIAKHLTTVKAAGVQSGSLQIGGLKLDFTFNDSAKIDDNDSWEKDIAKFKK